jgi:predicted branched-subunit amino acid permease
LAWWQGWWRDADVRHGARDMLTLVPGALAWGLVTGLAMVKVLGVPLSLLMSLLVYAGGAQLATLPLLATSAPLWVVLLTGLVVNLRFVIYSVQWRWYFGHLPRLQRLLLGFFATDQSVALFMRAYPQAEPAPGQLRYFTGSASVMWLGWQGGTLMGIVGADWVPVAWGLGFVGVLALLGLACALVSDWFGAVSAALAGAAAVAAYGLPFKLHIIVAVVAGVAAGLVMERVARGHGQGGQGGKRTSRPSA